MYQSNVPRTLYFDNAASTPIYPEVQKTLAELSRDVYGNPSSAHRAGKRALDIVQSASETIARHFDVLPAHVIFTSGGTESNNLAVFGALGGLPQVFSQAQRNSKPRIITSATEHPSIEKPFHALKECGYDVREVLVNHNGHLRLDELDRTCHEEGRVRLASFHHVQNETGVIQNLSQISGLVRKHHPDALIHTDAVQSFGKIPASFDSLGVDLISISGHKIGAPKGIGALVLGRRFEKRTPKLGSILLGSTQQNGLRAGTVPAPLIGALVYAVQLSTQNLERNHKHLISLRNDFIEKLKTVSSRPLTIHGPQDFSDLSLTRAPHTVMFSIPGLPSSVTLEALSQQGICVSAGSACHSTNPKPNQTLMQMGVSRELSQTSIRVSFSTHNTLEEVSILIMELRKAIETYASDYHGEIR